MGQKLATAIVLITMVGCSAARPGHPYPAAGDYATNHYRLLPCTPDV
jgi:hypothetical protein